ncbi:hypothetical protein D623_10033209 [Myotis brandtii]|uniref:Uncharacterized protein n=1 Tax=Myotis brandtii TaxID=109478 RepID=S7PLI7_MYOBR|nr:hypothetical protein D623_10033209 [Myotis brandtii]
MDQGPGREVGENSAASGHASLIRAPCLSEADWSASLEPLYPFASHLAHVLAADGPSSSHPPASLNDVALLWTDFGDPALEGRPFSGSHPALVSTSPT